MQLSFWRRISNSTLSGQCDCHAGEAEAEAASLMVPQLPVAQELTQFNIKPLSRGLQFVLGFIQNRVFRFTCKMECTQYYDEQLAETSQFLAPSCPLGNHLENPNESK
jgi:hypothetical protein